MTSVRNHIIKRICKAVGVEKPKLSQLSVLKCALTSDIDENKFVLKLPAAVLEGALGAGKRSCTGLLPDAVLEDVKVQEFSGQSHYTFTVNTESFIRDALTPLKTAPEDDINTSDETVVVEYSSPNIAKPFHLGHLRSTVLGGFVASLLQERRYKRVIKLNYLGDWGGQFGYIQAGLEYIGALRQPKDVSSWSVDLERDPLRVINKAYVLANNDPTLAERAKVITATLEQQQCDNSADEQQDNSARELWRRLRQLTVKHLADTYRILGITFDEYSWESEYSSSFPLHLLHSLRTASVLQEIDGQQVVVKDGKKLEALLKSDGGSLYLSRDLMAAVDRCNRYSPSRLFYVIDKSQSGHMSALEHTMRAVDSAFPPIQHVQFGRVTGMSTRKGTGLFLSDVLSKATEIMAQQQLHSPNTRDDSFETTQTLAVSTLNIFLLRQRRTRDFAFAWETALQGKGDSGVKLQYTHSRLCSLEQSCGVSLPTECHSQLLLEPEAIKLVEILHRYEQVMDCCVKDFESSYLVNYLFKLCNAVSVCLKRLPVKGETSDLASQRLWLFHCTRSVLNSSMRTLGLKPLNSM